jgi:hypothetical protein
MPNGRPTQVKHYEGMVIDQSGQRGRYSVCGVLYEVSSRGGCWTRKLLVA